MAEKHQMQSDGVLGDGVTFYPANSTRLAMYERAREQLTQFDEPVLIHAGNPHEYLFVAALDGTGNDVNRDPEHATNVGRIRQAIAARTHEHPNIQVDYVAGAGTQSSALKRAVDGADGYTCEERAELMYKKFIEQAKEWREADPNARVSVASVGFSRGADEAAIFARLVHERGLQDPAGAKYTYTSDGLVKHVEYTLPPLIAPGQVAQAVALMDPVGTGSEVRNDDRRLPPSVISGIQLTSTDEHRWLFKSDHIIDPGITPDGRLAGIYVPGAHSDVGGSYHRNGLSNRAGNLVIDYLNGLSDQPFLTKQPEPDDPRLNVVHRSEEGMFIYRVTPKVDRLKSEGYRELLVPRRNVGKVADPFNNEARDEALNAGYARQAMPDGPVPGLPAATVDPLSRSISAEVDRMLAAARTNEWSAFRQGTERFAAMDPGQALRQETRTAVDNQTQTRELPPQRPDLPTAPVQGWQR
ncbi:phospholipase effector Tle1 domain-containing protein [Dyella sp.]|jgi:hypothetical protein|uniref:phospholipase effector Tle1 domain-containing protein n=1 Tax=Dyella sp. TaxID=1869338 RepID=UPI002D796034|nr:DUF2235 domain-containing protein [Dyella sp.]HET6431648.1 DUF2235 domain-containing protein [Dyella sp.]